MVRLDGMCGVAMHVCFAKWQVMLSTFGKFNSPWSGAQMPVVTSGSAYFARTLELGFETNVDHLKRAQALGLHGMLPRSEGLHSAYLAVTGHQQKQHKRSAT